jgi:hypothetical protein
MKLLEVPTLDTGLPESPDEAEFVPFSCAYALASGVINRKAARRIKGNGNSLLLELPLPDNPPQTPGRVYKIITSLSENGKSVTN